MKFLARWVTTHDEKPNLYESQAWSCLLDAFICLSLVVGLVWLAFHVVCYLW